MNLNELVLEIADKERFEIKRDLGGMLNKNCLIHFNNKKCVLRISADNFEHKESIEREYKGIGYSVNGDEYSYRDIDEQIIFSNICLQKNIPVAKIIYHNDNYMITEFIEGREIPDILKSEQNISEIINKYLSSLVSAHNKGIVFGDRWGFNTIIDKEENIIHFDFDIKINTEDAKEFEISQAVYYSLLFSRDKDSAIECLKDFLKKNEIKSMYDRNRVINFLNGHSKYFMEHNIDYGGIELETERLIDGIKPKIKVTSLASEDEKTMIFICNNKRYRISLDSEVAKPNHYTKFLFENILSSENHNGRALDIGIGTGVYIPILREKGYSYIDGIDINQRAVEFTRKIMEEKNLGKYVRIFWGAFPEDFNLDEKYNFIISNPPQIPTPPDISLENTQLVYTNEGGADGRQTVDKIITNVSRFLEEGGNFRMVQADFIGIEKTLEIMLDNGLKPEIIDTKKERPGPFTCSRIDYIESLGYKFQKDNQGAYFNLAVINGEK